MSSPIHSKFRPEYYNTEKSECSRPTHLTTWTTGQGVATQGSAWGSLGGTSVYPGPPCTRSAPRGGKRWTRRAPRPVPATPPPSPTPLPTWPQRHSATQSHSATPRVTCGCIESQCQAWGYGATLGTSDTPEVTDLCSANATPTVTLPHAKLRCHGVIVPHLPYNQSVT